MYRKNISFKESSAKKSRLGRIVRRTINSSRGSRIDRRDIYTTKIWEAHMTPSQNAATARAYHTRS